MLEGNAALLASVRATATRNQDVYLTWDHMDVYFATSKRKRWEFEDLFWYLEERISGCVYQVVSKDRKLTNCF